MNTKIIDNILNINYKSLSKYDQFIIIDKQHLFDTHYTYLVQDIFKNCLYYIQQIKLDYQGDIINLEQNKLLIILINNTPLLIANCDYQEMFDDKCFFGGLLNSMEYKYLLNNSNNKYDLNDNDKIFFYTLQINDDISILITCYITMLNFKINNNFHFSLITKENKLKTFIVDNGIEFIKNLINITNDQGLINFKKDIIDILEYSIIDYINGNDNSNFINLLGKKSQEYFKPIYNDKDFNIYFDYYYNHIVASSNNCICRFLGGKYKRIYDELNNYYFVNSDFYPFIDSKFEDKNQELCNTIDYMDCEGLIINQCDYKVIIDGIAVTANKDEIKDIKNRKQTFDILTNNEED